MPVLYWGTAFGLCLVNRIASPASLHLERQHSALLCLQRRCLTTRSSGGRAGLLGLEISLSLNVFLICNRGVVKIPISVTGCCMDSGKARHRLFHPREVSLYGECCTFSASYVLGLTGETRPLCLPGTTAPDVDQGLGNSVCGWVC